MSAYKVNGSAEARMAAAVSAPRKPVASTPASKPASASASASAERRKGNRPWAPKANASGERGVPAAAATGTNDDVWKEF